ncbi:MAG: DUF1573 domain-containing protein [Candidatus Eisenbacteria bacterium]
MRGARAAALPALLVLAAALALPVAASGAPSLVIGPPSIDLGILEGDRVVPFSVALRNDGDEPLAIHEVNPTCGCTVVLLSDSLILPGESVPLTGTFSTRKLEGEIRKPVILRTNDPERARAVFLIRAWVQRALTLSDDSIDFGVFAPGEMKEGRILFRPSEGIELAILGVEGPEDRYRFWTAGGERPGDLVLHVTLLPQPEGTVVEDTIHVRTNVEGRETIRLPVRGRVKTKER